MAYHYFAKGWFFYQPWLNNFTFPLYKIYDALKWVFFDQFRFIGSILIIGTIVWRKYKLIFNKETSLLWFNIIGYIFLFSSFSFFLLRYFLPIIPLLFIFFSATLLQFNKNIKFLVVLIIIFLFFTQWFGNRNTHDGVLLESNLEYLDLIRLHKLTIDYLTQNYLLNTPIIADSPICDDLAQPFLHYVKKPFQNVECFEPDIVDISEVKLIILPYQGSHFYIFKEKIDHLNLTLIKRFEINGKITEIYENKI